MVNKCYLCMNAVESCNHLLLWCPAAYDLWNMIYGLLGIKWVMSGAVREEILAWDELCKRR